ncbi:hypothetical protein BGW42_002215 [Actinomortierella wolfii]|nr:hypothetical protein BGW42_002215 [Actinomortierella wolfii]
MARYGSGGLPEFVLMAMAEKRINSAIGLERRTRAYHCPKYVNEDKYFMETVRELKKRSVDFGKLTWCKVATIIQMCWRVSTTVDKTWGGWLLKVAVHAACTLERYQHGALEPSLAAMTLFQLSWEIAYGTLYMVLSDFIRMHQVD